MFAPCLERAVSFLHASQQSFGIEGEVILPETAAQLRSEHDARIVFLIRRAATPADVRDRRGPNPWLKDAAPDLVASGAAEVAAWSSRGGQPCPPPPVPRFGVGERLWRA